MQHISSMRHNYGACKLIMIWPVPCRRLINFQRA